MSVMRLGAMECRIQLSSPQRFTDGVVYIGTAQQKQKVPIQRSGLGGEVHYEGESSFLVFESEDAREPIAEVSLPEGGKHFMVALVPLPAEMMVSVVRDLEKDDLQGGERMVVNRLPNKIQVELSPVLPMERGAEDNFLAECESVGVLKVPTFERKLVHFAAMPVVVEQELDGEWKMVTQGRWFHMPQKKAYVILTPREKGRVNLYTVTLN
ncbi:hypothetical protein ACFSW8_04425 [Rubritalea tangerina]|uniref:Uncharacterized protein n=2 Tax=Rubritalea tangerina TaxID=430798 RepID=A0ABW4Z939_9BACT